jgi:D-alanine transaminase
MAAPSTIATLFELSGRKARMARYAYVNGQYVDHRTASVHIEDRGYQLADGVYEVVGVRDGRLIDEGPHIDRLDRSLGELRIGWPLSRATLSFILRELMRRNRLRDGLIYMQVTRGVARRDHAFPTGPVKPAIVITTKNSKRGEADTGLGVAVKSLPDIRWGRCDIKTVALLPNVLAKQAARESGAYEAWLIDAQGCVTEGASTNAWIVTRNDELITRQTDHGILAGITRQTLKKLSDSLQLKFVERPFSLAEAKQAKEAFISSATSFVTPVVKIDGEVVGDGKPGAIARRLREEYVRFASSVEAVT